MHLYIRVDTFKIKQNFYHKIYIISQIIFKKVNVIRHILKFLTKFNTTYDFFFLFFNKIKRVVIFVVQQFLLSICDFFFFSSLILDS